MDEPEKPALEDALEALHARSSPYGATDITLCEVFQRRLGAYSVDGM
jgi:hypothetical protein